MSTVHHCPEVHSLAARLELFAQTSALAPTTTTGSSCQALGYTRQVFLHIWTHWMFYQPYGTNMLIIICWLMRKLRHNIQVLCQGPQLAELGFDPREYSSHRMSTTWKSLRQSRHRPSPPAQTGLSKGPHEPATRHEAWQVTSAL